MLILFVHMHVSCRDILIMLCFRFRLFMLFIMYNSLENGIEWVILMIVFFDIFHHVTMFLDKTDWVMYFEISIC
jgi:hypothetical protein